MQQLDFWRLESLSDTALLGGLAELVGSSRQTLARLLAHLAEVEERRLHLDMGYSSLFVYCTKRLGLSEDEAARRIEVSRLARRHPDIFCRIASGQLSLSVAALLKPHLTGDNAGALLELVSGSSIARAREQLAAHFPRPDVPSTLRKLPERSGSAPRTSTQREPACAEEARPMPLGNRDVAPLLARVPSVTSTVLDGSSMPPRAALTPVTRSPSTVRRNFEPLSNARYKLQLTADTDLKKKLELARDLMRHTQPDGDLAPILSRALDLLIEQLMKRRFGACSERRAADRPASMARPPAACPKPAHPKTIASPTVTPTPVTSPPVTPSPVAPPPVTPPPVTPTPVTSPPRPSPPRTAPPRANAPPPPPPAAPPSPPLPPATRRLVAERDGLRCSWQAPDGTRCETRAWLEHDHARPHGRGGDASPQNIRLLCRAHNRRAAEKEYGRAYIDHCATRAMSRRAGHEQRDEQRSGASSGT